MSLTLLSAAGTNVVFDLTKQSANTQVFQNIGTSYQDTKTLTQSQAIGKTATAKSRFNLKVPYTFTEGTVVKTDYMFFTIEGTIPATAPLTEVGKGVYMVKTLAGLVSTEDLIKGRRFSAA